MGIFIAKKTMDTIAYVYENGENILTMIMTLKGYLGTEDEAVCQSVAQKALIIGYTRLLRRSARRPHEGDSAAKIERCKQKLAELLPEVDTLLF